MLHAKYLLSITTFIGAIILGQFFTPDQSFHLESLCTTFSSRVLEFRFRFQHFMNSLRWSVHWRSVRFRLLNHISQRKQLSLLFQLFIAQRYPTVKRLRQCNGACQPLVSLECPQLRNRGCTKGETANFRTSEVRAKFGSSSEVRSKVSKSIGSAEVRWRPEVRWNLICSAELLLVWYQNIYFSPHFDTFSVYKLDRSSKIRFRPATSDFSSAIFLQ